MCWVCGRDTSAGQNRIWGIDYADLPAGPSTPASVAVGGSYSDVLEVVGDQDWIAVNLVAGTTYSFALDGSGATPLSDPFVELRNAGGGLLASNDDGGPGTNSLLSYAITTSGTYYVNARAYDNAYAGGYTLTVTDSGAPPPGSLPVFTFNQIADQLTDGYWQSTGGSRHAFGTTTITYNIEGLTPDGQALAIAAFAGWAGVTGLNFVRTTGTAQITFDDNQAGAFASYSSIGGVTQSSNVNVSTQWLVDNGTGINTYSFQTYLHEIGHSLGLGHGGNYNSSATWSANPGASNHYLNDSWQQTLMSYFNQNTNTFVNATHAYVVGPMIADIIAIQNLYGTPTNIRPTATTYGFNNTAEAIFNFAAYAPGEMPAFSIFDSGGRDTIDASGFSAVQLINLTPGSYSNIGGETGNIGIATNTIIENAVGGSGADTILGNGVNNWLRGNAGADTIDGDQGFDIAYYAGARGNYTLTRLVSGEVSVAANGGFAAIDGTDSIRRVEALGFADVTMSAQADSHFANDFSSDVLLRHIPSGSVSFWDIDAGAFSSSTSLGSMGSNIEIVDTGDFNQDGFSDLLLRDHISGLITNWTVANGAFQASTVLGLVGANFMVVGAGDFNTDGTSDILLRDLQTGGISTWLINPNNSFSASIQIGGMSSNVEIAGIGDFFADGGSDLLLRDWTTGAVTIWHVSAGNFVGSIQVGGIGSNFDVVGAYDFTGDTVADILLRDRTTGSVTYWKTDSGGAFVSSTQIGGIGSNFSIIDARDVNGDGYNDVILRDSQTGSIFAFGTYGGEYSGFMALGGAGGDFLIA